MKKISSRNNYSVKTKTALFAGTAALLALTNHAQASDPLIDKLEQKGILTESEAKDLRAESDAEQTNLVNSIPASKWKIADSIKSIQLFGDVRLRYEYRGADNIPPDATGSTYYRERFRYAVRVGIKGDLFDDFNYGIRLETATNPRSPWATFGNGSGTTAGNATPSDKAGSGIGIGQAFIGWHPADWYEMTVGRMSMPLYTTPMVWDSDINPEGAFEKFNTTIGNVNLFADFGQFDYADPNPASTGPSSDTFVLTWQVGATVKLPKNMSFKIAPMIYNYTGISASGNGLNQPFIGQAPASGKNLGVPGAGAAYLNPGNTDYNSDGLNDLLVLEVPFEYDFKIPHTAFGALQARFFGDFAYNIEGNERANASFNANPGAFTSYGLTGPAHGQNIAYQVGFGIGSDGPEYGPTKGLVYGSTSKKGTWEARAYWQHIEQDSLDVNLIDSDFFEGRANLEGFYLAFAYSFTDAIIGTVRYGHATRIDTQLGTGGNNLDIPGINPINNYNLVQMDLTWRF